MRRSICKVLESCKIRITTVWMERWWLWWIVWRCSLHECLLYVLPNCHGWAIFLPEHPELFDLHHHDLLIVAMHRWVNLRWRLLFHASLHAQDRLLNRLSWFLIVFSSFAGHNRIDDFRAICKCFRVILVASNVIIQHSSLWQHVLLHITCWAVSVLWSYDVLVKFLNRGLVQAELEVRWLNLYLSIIVALHLILVLWSVLILVCRLLVWCATKLVRWTHQILVAVSLVSL